MSQMGHKQTRDVRPCRLYPRKRTPGGHRAMSEKCQRATSTRSRSVRSGGRDRELKESTLRFARDCPQPSAVGFDDRAADRQAYAHALGLGRVEGLEQTREALWAQPRAG